MEPTPGPPQREDDRNAWLPFAIVAALIVLLFLAAIIVFRHDDEAGPEGSLPESFDTISTVPSTPPTTPPATPPTTPPAVVVPPTRAPSGGGSAGTAEGPSESSALPIIGGSTEALRRYAEQAGATETSDVVPIGSDLYAMILVNGRGQLLRWNSREWVLADRLVTPAPIREVATADVTGDGTQDFLITLGGLSEPGGVYSRATFQFGMLPFSTLQGPEDFVDGLVYRLGKLQSPFRDASGSRTLTWTWTGQMFETR
jgi:hypothetical protein